MPYMAKGKTIGSSKYTKHFPKDFCNETMVKEDRYLIYWHYNNLNTAYIKLVKGKQVPIDNH
jgi:hypothetical protein